MLRLDLFALVLVASISITDARAHALGGPLYAHCAAEGQDVVAVCDAYLEQYFPRHFDSLKYLLEALDDRKDQARDWAAADRRWLVSLQWLIVALSGIVTIMISLSTLWSIDLRRWAVVPSAVVVAISSLASFYDFGRSHTDNIQAQTNYALLLDGLEFDLVSAVEDGDIDKIDRVLITRYRQALSDAVTERKDAFLDIVLFRSAKNEDVSSPN